MSEEVEPYVYAMFQKVGGKEYLCPECTNPINLHKYYCSKSADERYRPTNNGKEEGDGGKL